ncbi:hypothetical protein Tco_1520940, partial [Tanacetum coccineum]
LKYYKSVEELKQARARDKDLES